MRYRFKAAAKTLLSQRSAWWFVTLTLPPYAREWNIAKQKSTVSKGWGKLQKRLHRETGGKVAYLYVLESHEEGTLHFHGVIDKAVTKTWLSKNWMACVGAYIVDIKPVTDTAGVIRYLAKDLLEWRNIRLPRGFRRYGAGGGVKMTGVRPIKRKPAPLPAVSFKAPVIGTASDQPIAHETGFLVRPNDLVIHDDGSSCRR